MITKLAKSYTVTRIRLGKSLDTGWIITNPTPKPPLAHTLVIDPDLLRVISKGTKLDIKA